MESQTVVGTKQHGRGSVEARVVKANIPVVNGIVHLIDRPLVVMATALWQHLDPTKLVSLRTLTLETNPCIPPEQPEVQVVRRISPQESQTLGAARSNKNGELRKIQNQAFF